MDKQRQNAEAGPSGTQPESPFKPPNGADEGSKRTTRNAANGENSFGNDDFVAFSFSDSEEADKQSARASSPPVREWDRGKVKGNDREEHAGRKRKVEEFDFDDGYANKKQRVAAASRKAPWAQDVDWDKCANVAEMYVYPFFLWRSETVHITTCAAFCKVALRSGGIREVHVTDPNRGRSPFTFRHAHCECNSQIIPRCRGATVRKL